MYRNIYPLAAIVGQESLKQTLLITAVNPATGGVLIRGEKGTAKSTAVRALAGILPQIDVVMGCPFSCDPDKPELMCPQCRQRYPQLVVEQRRVRVVNLPLNATEDRVAGGIDFTLALCHGRPLLSPGLIAQSHRGILYVDEVNLLDDHIVDIILDAAASGENRIEREGISFSHQAKFMLVGTMNPEEGELRPQLLDRFGLCVEVSGTKDPDERVSLMELRDNFDRNRRNFTDQYDNESAQLARQIADARKLLPHVRISRHLRGFISELCTENSVAGHRADLVMEQASRALAALKMQREVTLEHIREIAPMVLIHRRRDSQPPPPPPPPPPPDESDSDRESEPEENSSDEQEKGSEENGDKERSAQSSQPDGQSSPDDKSNERSDREKRSESQPEPQNGEDHIFDIGMTFKVRHLSSEKDRMVRRGSGRRSRTRVSQKQGRYVKSCMKPEHGDIALDATLRAAAPYQRSRRNGFGNSGSDNVRLDGDEGPCFILRSEDLRGRVREKRIGNFLLFLVDASGSMGARGRMAASKGAVMSLLLDAYQKRDRVGMISFRRDGAVVNLPPTTSVELAGKLLAQMAVGGRTPLSAGLVKTYEQVRNLLLRDPSARPIVIIITDGKSNVAMTDERPLDEVSHLARTMSLNGQVQYIVVDTEEAGIVSFGLARSLADTLHARYFKIDDLKTQTLVDIVKGELL